MTSNLKNPPRVGLGRLAGAVSLSVLAIAMATPAEAQTGPANQPAQSTPPTGATPPGQVPDAALNAPPAAAGNAIVITGFRGSLAKALNMKRSENASTDSILAEDIGKFPDLNLSESIQRIPGVALQRDGGE